MSCWLKDFKIFIIILYRNLTWVLIMLLTLLIDSPHHALPCESSTRSMSKPNYIPLSHTDLSSPQWFAKLIKWVTLV